MRTRSGLIHLSNSPGVFGHRANVIWGSQGMTGDFLLEKADTLQVFQKEGVHLADKMLNLRVGSS